MRWAMTIILIVVILLLTSCKEPTNEELFYEIQKTYNNMESYSLIADIRVIGNLSEKTYQSKQIFKKPSNYILEILQPPDSKGMVTIFNGEQAWFQHPGLDDAFIIRDFKDSIDNNLFFGYFLEVLATTEEMDVTSEELGTETFLVLKVAIPGNNKYRHTQKLYIDKKDFTPYKLIILDKDKNLSAEVFYRDFQFNIDIQDEDFSMKVINQHLNTI